MTEMDTNENIEESPSWVIREKVSKKVILETFNIKIVKALNKTKYEAIPILKYLQEFNLQVKNSSLTKPNE